MGTNELHPHFIIMHAMHLGDKWGILTLDLNCHFNFEALENVEPLIPKHNTLIHEYN
jgi:hypothetical protein